MKKNAMRKNLSQSILKSLGRYIAIVLIIALGSSLFMGLLMTKTDMVATGQKYMDRQNMFDLRLISSYGWTGEQVEKAAALSGVKDAEGVLYLDVAARLPGAEDDSVYRMYTIPEKLNRIALRGGRMPQAPNECLIDGFMADDSFLGMELKVSSNNSEDTLDAMVYDSYTIVGYVATPLYMDLNRGTTSVGNGSIETYFYVPEGAIDAEYFTEINLTIPGQFDVYSESYNSAMKQAADTLEPDAEALAQERFQSIRQEAEDAYQEGYAEYLDGVKELEEGRLEAETELADAYSQLSDAEKEITNNEKILAAGQRELNKGWQEIAENEKTLAKSREELKKAKADTYAQLDEAQAELDKNAKDVAEGLAQVEAGLVELEAGLSQVNDGIAQLEEALPQIQEGITQLEPMMPLLEAAVDVIEAALRVANSAIMPDTEQIAELTAKLEEAKAELDSYSAQLEELYVMRETYFAQLQELYATRAQLEVTRAELLVTRQTLLNAQVEIDLGSAQLEAGRAEADAQFADAEAQLADGEKQLQDGKNTLSSSQRQLNRGKKALEEGKEELAEGWQEYYDGKAEAEAEIADAEAKLAEAEAELADAREEIDSLEEPTVMVLDRNTNVGYNSLKSSSDIVQGVSRVLPVFFLLVAALVCITTMTRMIDEERTQIGTLKALGYSNGAIISKYLLYAGSGAVIGCGLGTIVGSVIFPMILWEVYKIMLHVTPDTVLKFNWWLIVAVVGVYTALMLAVTWYCCRKALEEQPAELIRPKAPEAGKKIFMEYLPFWRRISFLNKVTIRNTFRYRQRLAMMLVGIGGCTALLVTGFGLRDSIVGVVDTQFENVTLYDMTVSFSEAQSREDQLRFTEDVSDSAEDFLFCHQSIVEIDFDGQTKETYMIVSDSALEEFIKFRDDGEILPMPGKNEVLLSVGMAEMLDLHAGDQVTLRDSDMKKLELTVSGIYENHVSNYAVVISETVQEQWGGVPKIQSVFLRAEQGTDIHELSAEISGLEDVPNVSVSQDLAEMVNGILDALELIVVVVVFCAGLLAVIVLYNLTNININERIREIATIKVLGFRAGETAMYVFKENLALTLIGAVFGLGLGYLLLVFVMSQVKIDMVWFSVIVKPLSYGLSFVLTVFSAVIVDFVFYFKLDKINMAEALKSVE
ncbi:MAG: FtsX-like permease family protein [Oscillospiraceae bacterium]|nr:FtsX-like permease family protein [Oscillospiraceae bacterium]